MKPERLAVIGVGLIGLRHAELIQAHDACSLVGLCDVDPSRKAVADRFGVPFYASIEELIEREQPSGAIIATSNPMHAAVADVCAQRSVHLLIEKPIASTLRQAQRIVETARECGIRVLVGHHRRHNPLIQKVRDLVRSGALGRLTGVSILWALMKPDAYFDVGWRRERPGGGPGLINLIHELDSLRFICSEIEEVFARTSSAARGFEVEDSLSISLRFENGALGTILASDATPAPCHTKRQPARIRPTFVQTRAAITSSALRPHWLFPKWNCGAMPTSQPMAGQSRWSRRLSKWPGRTRWCASLPTSAG